MNDCCPWKFPFLCIACLAAVVLALFASGCIFVKS